MGIFGEDKTTTELPRPAVPVLVPEAQFEAEATYEVGLLIKSGHRLIFLETVEETRALTIVAEIARQQQIPLVMWDSASGLQQWDAPVPNEETANPAAALAAVADTPSPIICVMQGLAPHMQDHRVQSLLDQIGRAKRSTVVAIDAVAEVSQSLRNESVIYKLPRPPAAMIERHVERRIAELGHQGMRSTLDEDAKQRLANALRGLTVEEIDRIVTRLAVEDRLLDENDIPAAQKMRSERLQSSDCVVLVNTSLGIEWLAGFDNFKQWVNSRRPVLDEKALEFGLSPSRGVLLTGVPGCGKSFAIKTLAETWHLPLLRLEAGSLYAKFIGETESNLRAALDVAEALAPSILWIDELEKAVSAKGSSETDGGLSYRLSGMLLTWMQERTAPVFLAATANNVSELPPELTRQGRFDEVFFVELPDLGERRHQFALQLARKRRDWKVFDCEALALASDGFSGAEIEQAVANALYAAYSQGVEVTTDLIRTQIANTVPLSKSARGRIDEIRAWGRAHARPA